MTMSLLRFSFDFAKFERYKETGRYSFPLTINLRPFCEQVYTIFLWCCHIGLQVLSCKVLCFLPTD